MERRERRDLPSAKSSGLRIVLYALWTTTTTTTTQSSTRYIAPKIKPSQEELLKHIRAVFEIADAYDIPKLPDLLICAYYDDPFMTYTLAAIASDEARARGESMRILSSYIGDMSSAIMNTLRICAPRYLDRLRKLHHETREGFEDLKYQFESAWPTCNGFDDFGKNCYKRDGCEGYRKWREFKAMRKVAARKAFTALRSVGHSRAEVLREIRTAVNDTVDCGPCSARLRSTFMSAWDKYDVSKAKSI